MRWERTVGPKAGSIRIQYDLEWLRSVMQVSATSMVPFTFFSEPTKKMSVTPDRSYPRSLENPGFILGKNKPSADAAAGGRKHINLSRVDALCHLFEGDFTGPDLPLSDLVIWCKRAVCAVVSSRFSTGKHFRVRGGAPPPSSQKQAWEIHGYPMLCVTWDPARLIHLKGQGTWRLIQCVFGAVLTRFIRDRGIGLEVVAREGFGSVFPTLADIPYGIRLDPGLLPTEAGATAICEALTFTEAFIDVYNDACNTATKNGKPLALTFVSNMSGMQGTHLAAVDRLTSSLHEFFSASRMPDAAACGRFILGYKGSESKYRLPFVNASVDVVVNEVFSRAKGFKVKPLAEPREDSGYGSESEYEDDEPEPRARGDGDEEVAVRGGFLVRKYAVLSGMAALRMATFYGMYYSKALFGAKGGLRTHRVANTSYFGTWAPYFELEPDKIHEALPSKDGVRILIFDGAPNPINIPSTEPRTAPTDLCVIVIDTTNNTSREKAEYLAHFRAFLAQPEESQHTGGLLFMIDSASKHPTGGDLVHGVLRVFGTRASLDFFDKNALKWHLAANQTSDLKTSGSSSISLTGLNDVETAARRALLDARMVMRNRDLFAQGGDPTPSGTKTETPEVVSTSTSTTPSRGTSTGRPQSTSTVLMASGTSLMVPGNGDKVRRLTFAEAQAPQAKAKVKVKAKVKGKKEAPSTKGTPGSPKGAREGSGKAQEETLESKKKKFEALGSFAPRTHAAPDLTEDGRYYEEQEIYDLQRFLLRNRANVAVLNGVSEPQWEQMGPDAYTSAYQAAITPDTDTIIQSLNRGGNHWALVYITLGAAGMSGQRPVRLLYLDPLSPGNVPVQLLQLLRRPFPNIEAEHCILQYQNDNEDGMGFQNSCGAWVVHLAVHLATNGHTLPPVDENRQEAALALRRSHNDIIAQAQLLPLPV